MTGYMHAQYAASLAEFGVPRQLERSGGWVLVRTIPASCYLDATGCYPLYACPRWGELIRDLSELGTGLVTVCLVTDPFGDYTVEYLRDCFKDVVIPFKQHFVTDLSKPIASYVSAHNRRYAPKAMREVQVDKCAEPYVYLDDWVDLYAALIQRHSITGLRAFSRVAFAKQLCVPGVIAFRATYEGRTVGMVLWYTQGNVCYYHLGAYNECGYAQRASYALFWRAIEYFQEQHFHWLNLGAGAGVHGSSADGLTRFKQGWATETRTAYFCGRILVPERYNEIVAEKSVAGTDYFPAYRVGEFNP